MKPIKTLKPKQYSRFCYTWEKRLKRKFPKGMPINRENLKWAASFSGDGFDICLALSRLFNYRIASWFSWSYTPLDKIINLALEIYKQGKLAKTMIRKAGIKLWT